MRSLRASVSSSRLRIIILCTSCSLLNRAFIHGGRQCKSHEKLPLKASSLSVNRFSNRGLDEEKTGRKRIDPRYPSLSARTFLRVFYPHQTLPLEPVHRPPKHTKLSPPSLSSPKTYHRRTAHSNFGGEKNELFLYEVFRTT